MHDTSQFGRWLKRLRSALDLTQEALAEQAGYAVGTIRKLEQGERRPSREMAERLAHVLLVPPDEYEAFIQAARLPLGREPATRPAAATPPAQPILNLPHYFTPFVGRDQELAELARLLATPGCRLITVLGAGGIGKTRLAVEAAARCTHLRDGVAFVPLAPINQPAAIVPAIADALGFTFAGPTDWAVQLLGYLREKQVLLVLDNLEHLLDDVSLLQDLLVQTSGVTLLVTSRERLQLQAERVVELQGLPVPPAGIGQSLLDNPAIALFLAHGRLARLDFQLTTGALETVAEICRLVEGMPLGIELAATWLRVLSPPEIADEIRHNLHFLQTAARDRPARHHSLIAVFDHSWRLLSETERSDLRKLAVFRGGFSRAAATTVAGASLSLLAALVDKSLLRRTGSSRFYMHELVRQYALTKLQENAQEYAATQEQYATYYARWLAAQEQRLKGAQQQETVIALGAEIDNIRAAWDWAVAHARLIDLHRAAETLHWFYEFRSWFLEGNTIFERAAHTLARMAHATPTSEHTLRIDEPELACVYGQILAHHGYFASRLGQFATALDVLAQSLAVLDGCDDGLARARTEAYQGIVAYQRGDYAQASRQLQAGVAGASMGRDRWYIAFCLTFMGMVAHAQGNYQEALQHFRQALAAWRQVANPRGTLFCLTFFSATLYTLGEYDEAQGLLRESLRLSTATDDRWGMATALNHLGLVAHAQQDYQAAAYLFREGLVLFRETANRWDIARTLNHLGATMAASGAYREAKQAYQEALATATEAMDLPNALQALLGMASALRTEGNLERAFELATHVLRHPASSPEARERAVHLRTDLLAGLSKQQIDIVEQRVHALSFDLVVAELV